MKPCGSLTWRTGSQWAPFNAPYPSPSLGCRIASQGDLRVSAQGTAAISWPFFEVGNGTRYLLSPSGSCSIDSVGLLTKAGDRTRSVFLHGARHRGDEAP